LFYFQYFLTGNKLRIFLGSLVCNESFFSFAVLMIFPFGVGFQHFNYNMSRCRSVCFYPSWISLRSFSRVD
jgi:hypothetical protein